MNKTWILVADASKARIYSTQKATLFNGNGNLSLISEHEHANSRKKERDLITDKQGKFGTGTFVEATDPKQHEEESFAKELTEKLAKEYTDNHYNELIFIAPATFMGMLNKHISHELSKLINLTIEKDYTGCNERELVKHLQNYL